MYYNNYWQTINPCYVDANLLVKEIGNLQNQNYKLAEAKRLAEKKLGFYENGKFVSSEAVREIPEQCLLKVLVRGHEENLAFWCIEKCNIIYFETSLDERSLFLLLHIRANNGKMREIVLNEGDLKGAKIIDILENSSCQVMQAGSKTRRAVQILRYIRSKINFDNIKIIPYRSGWHDGKYYYSIAQNSVYREIFHLENPYTRDFFPDKILHKKDEKNFFHYLEKAFSREELTLVLTLTVFGMLYSVFSEYGHKPERVLSLENGRNLMFYEILMTQWVERRVFPVSNTKHYEKIIYNIKDSIIFFRTNDRSKYDENVLLNKLLPILENNELYNEKTGDVIKVESLCIVESSNYKIFDKTFKLPLKMDKNLKAELNPEYISGLYKNVCKWLEDNYEWIINEIKSAEYINNVPGFREINFCLTLSHKILKKYCSCNVGETGILDERSFSIFLIEWLSGEIDMSGKVDGDKLFCKILKMKEAGLISFISRYKYNSINKENTEFVVDDKWVYIPAEVICRIAEELFGYITKHEIKKALLQAGICEMEQDRFGTTVFVGKENKKMVMIRIERQKILNDAEMMQYMEV